MSKEQTLEQEIRDALIPCKGTDNLFARDVDEIVRCILPVAKQYAVKLASESWDQGSWYESKGWWGKGMEDCKQQFLSQYQNTNEDE